MFNRLGFWEIAIIIIIALVVFGPNKLPEMGKALGRGIREFKDATGKLTEELNSTAKAVTQSPSVSAPKPAATSTTSVPATTAETPTVPETPGDSGQVQ